LVVAHPFIFTELEVLPLFLLNDVGLVSSLDDFPLLVDCLDDLPPTESLPVSIFERSINHNVVYGIDSLQGALDELLYRVGKSANPTFSLLLTRNLY